MAVEAEVEASQRDCDVVVVSGAGIDTNVYLPGADIDFSVESNFTQNIDMVGQAGGYAARGFARLGRRTVLIDTVGADYHGEFIRRELERDGIVLDGVFTDPAGTRRSVNFIYADGRRKNFYDGKGAASFHPDPAVCARLFARSRLAHFNIINWARELLPVASGAEVVIACDIQDVVAANDPYRAEFIDAADVLFFSSVNHADPAPLIRTFMTRGRTKIVVAGMGARGCAVGREGTITRYPPVRLDRPVVDTNGAGDGLAVGFLSSYILDGVPLEEAILRGQIAARYSSSIRGKSDALITQEQLDHYVTVRGGTSVG